MSDETLPAPEQDSQPTTSTTPWRSCISLLLGVVLVLAAAVTIGALDQQRRSERATAAETKYGVRFVERVRDGEGGGLWRFPDGRTEVCRISGEVDDPTLRCGADLTEPEVFGNDFASDGERLR